jgi:hypothetical protein
MVKTKTTAFRDPSPSIIRALIMKALLKRRSNTMRLHADMSQKAVTFILTASESEISLWSTCSPSDRHKQANLLPVQQNGIVFGMILLQRYLLSKTIDTEFLHSTDNWGCAEWRVERLCNFSTSTRQNYFHTIILMMITSMRWDYVCELRQPTGLLLMPQVIYEHGEPWWNDMGRRKLLIRPPELSGNTTITVM